MGPFLKQKAVLESSPNLEQYRGDFGLSASALTVESAGHSASS
jgi:hypothetical protein